MDDHHGGRHQRTVCNGRGASEFEHGILRPRRGPGWLRVDEHDEQYPAYQPGHRRCARQLRKPRRLQLSHRHGNRRRGPHAQWHSGSSGQPALPEWLPKRRPHLRAEPGDGRDDCDAHTRGKLRRSGDALVASDGQIVRARWLAGRARGAEPRERQRARARDAPGVRGLRRHHRRRGGESTHRLLHSGCAAGV